MIFASQSFPPASHLEALEQQSEGASYRVTPAPSFVETQEPFQAQYSWASLLVFPRKSQSHLGVLHKGSVKSSISSWSFGTFNLFLNTFSVAETDSSMPGLMLVFLLGLFSILIQSSVLFLSAFIFSLHILIRLW